MITAENLSLSDPLSNLLQIKDDENVDINSINNNSKPLESDNSTKTVKRIQVPHTSSEFLTAWVDKLTTNSLSSLYILPFRELNSKDFIKLFNAIANCTSLNILTISGHDFGPECHQALTNALAKNASILTLDIGSNVLGLCTEEIETLSASNTASNTTSNSVVNTAANTTSNTASNISDIEDNGCSTPTLKKESNLSALLNGNSTPTPSSTSISTEIISDSNLNIQPRSESNGYLSHTNSDTTLVAPSPPSLNNSNAYKQYSSSTPSFIHQVSSALSRNLKSYTQTQNYLSSSQGVFNQHKKNIAKNHLYNNNQNPSLPTTEFGEKDVNEPDDLESFKAICTGIGMNQRIQHWNLDYKSIGFRASEVLADRVLLYNTTLVKLSLARNHLGDKGCIAICQALITSKNSTLKYLNLKDNDIGSEGMGEKGISGLLKACFHEEDEDEDNTNSSFDLNTNTPSSSYSSSFHPKYLAMTPLTGKTKTHRHNKSVTISDDVDVETSNPYISIEPISSYENNHSHSHNHYRSNSSGIFSTSYSSVISNSSLCSIHSYSHSHCGLRELDLSCNPIGDEGGILIGEALKYNTNLRELDLSNTDIGDDTIISISKSIESTLPPCTQEDFSDSPPRCSLIQHTSRLIKLSVNKNHIGPKGCEALGHLLEKNPRICSLSLKGNLFGDEGVKKLVRPLMISKSSIHSHSHSHTHTHTHTHTHIHTHQNSNSNSNSNTYGNTHISINTNSLSNNNGNNSQTNSPVFPIKAVGIPIINKDHHYSNSMGSNLSSCSSYNSMNGWPVPGVTAKSPASAGSNGGNSWSVFGVHSLSLSNESKIADSDWDKQQSNNNNNSNNRNTNSDKSNTTNNNNNNNVNNINRNSLSVQDLSGSYIDSNNSLNFNGNNNSNHCKNTRLSSLYLSANNITMKGFIDLIQSCPSLKLLDLHKNNICLTEKDDFSTVIKKFGLNKLRELYLSDNNMSVTDLRLICNMIHSGLSPKLEELSLTGNVSLYDDDIYEEWEEKITQLELDRPCLSITWR